MKDETNMKTLISVGLHKELFFSMTDQSSMMYTDSAIVIHHSGAHVVTKYKVHRLILASLSPLLEEILGDRTESIELILDNVSKEEVENLICHMYTGSKNVISRGLAKSLGLKENPDIIMKQDDIEDGLLKIKTEYLDDEKEITFCEGDPFDQIDDFLISPTKEESLDPNFIPKSSKKKSEKEKRLIYEKNIKLKEERSKMEKLLHAYPERFRLYNKFAGSRYDQKKGGMSDEEYLKKKKSWTQFPGIIFDNEVTIFVACIECAQVFRNASSSHICTTSVDFLKDKDIEIVKDWVKNTSDYVRSHFKQVNVDKLGCVHCDQIFDNRSSFKQHIEAEHGIETNLNKNGLAGKTGKHVCDECGARYVSQRHVDQHKITKHGRIELGNHKCKICDMVFIQDCLLKKHIHLKHTDDRPYICDTCAKGFKTKKHLDNHRSYVHNNSIRLWPCRHCDKSFAKDWTRTQHERLHLGIKPYECQEDKCDAKFSQKTSLDCHMKTHHKNI